MKTKYKIIEVLEYKNGQVRHNTLDKSTNWIGANNAYRRRTTNMNNYDLEIMQLCNEYHIVLFDLEDKQIYRTCTFVEDGKLNWEVINNGKSEY